MELLKMMQERRSVRTYTGEPVPEEKLNKVLQAGLLSPTGRSKREWEFIVVRNKETLKKLTYSRTGAANMLEGADCAIVVFADETQTDVWVEDCSVAMANMYLMADSLGLGSCWIQGRLRETKDGRSTEEYVRELLEVPGNYRLLAMLSLGMPKEKPEAYELSDLMMEKVHAEKF